MSAMAEPVGIGGGEMTPVKVGIFPEEFKKQSESVAACVGNQLISSQIINQ